MIVICGTNASDDISGTQGDDAIFGGAGDDWIKLRLQLGGGHVVTGGAGADTFAVLSLKEGLTAPATRTDSEIGTDRLTIEDHDLATYCLSRPATPCVDTAAGALVTLAGGDPLLFANIDAATLWSSCVVPIG